MALRRIAQKPRTQPLIGSNLLTWKDSEVSLQECLRPKQLIRCGKGRYSHKEGILASGVLARIGETQIEAHRLVIGIMKLPAYSLLCIRI